MKNFGEACVLEDRSCSECGECDQCDQDLNKQCDSCGQCLDMPDGDYAEIEIDDILLNKDQPNLASRHKRPIKKYKLKS